jgi:hypothetical protein
VPSPAAIDRAIRSQRRFLPLELSNPVIAALVVVALVIWPVYVFPAGYPQPVTFALLLAFVCVLIKDPASVAGMIRKPEIRLIALFLVYSLVVNSIFSMFYQDPEPLRNSAYYMQVLLGCIAINYVLRTEPTAPRLLTIAILGALAVQFVTFAVSVPVQGVRATLLFENPNQLGFFGLLALAFILLLQRYTGYPAIVSALGAAVSVLFVMLSLSKGAILAGFALLFLYLLLTPIRDRRWQRLRPALLIAFPLAVIAIAVIYRDQIAMLGAVADRLAEIGASSDDSFAGRSYIRIAIWPQYLLFGAGEGLLNRWEYPREIHSMFGTLLFSYGLPGLGIVCVLLAVVWRRNPRDFIIYFVPILLYSVVHQPMRQSMMWTLLIAIAHFGPVSGTRASGYARKR